MHLHGYLVIHSLFYSFNSFRKIFIGWQLGARHCARLRRGHCGRKRSDLNFVESPFCHLLFEWLDQVGPLVPLPVEGKGYLFPSLWAQMSSHNLFRPMKWTKVTCNTFMWKVYVPALGPQPTLSVFPLLWAQGCPQYGLLLPFIARSEGRVEQMGDWHPVTSDREKSTFLRFLESFVTTAWLGLS